MLRAYIQTKAGITAVLAMAREQKFEEETLSHWARYLCILASGLVETSLKSILMDYVSANSHPVTVNFVESKLERITNLNEEKVYQLLNAFQPAWAQSFREKRTEEQKAALDSVVANRNQIAHGGSVDLSFARMADYYREIVGVLDLIERQCIK